MPTEAEALAREILSLAQGTLLAELRFLAAALCRLEWAADPGRPLATDGLGLYYDFVYVLRRWRTDKAALLRGYLHLVLHCLYHHPFVGPEVDQAVWDLACDIAVEAGIDELELACTACERSPEAAETLAALRKALRGGLTAERIYRYYAARPLSALQLENLRAPFRRDEHDLWYRHSEQKKDKAADERNDGDDGGADGENRHRDGGEEQPGAGDDARAGQPQAEGKPQAAPGRAGRREQAKAQWEQLAAQVRTDLETHSRRWGSKAGTLLANLRAATRKRLDYAEFLRRFAVLAEAPRPDDDAFDLIFYTYGLRLYGNMPLVEPQETREEPRVRAFVIVLDTSGSIQPDKARNFLQRTGEILLQEDSYDARAELHLIQCDAAVQQDTVLTGREALAAALENLPVRGGGGTDFRPAFAYIEQLRAGGALADLRGILYFTDGDGTYPETPPGPAACKTAFVFADAADAAAPRTPPWAIRVLLDPETLGRPQILILE